MTDLPTLALAWVRDPAYVEMTARQIALLGLITQSGPQGFWRVRELAPAIGASKPVITRALNAFEVMGLAERVRDPDDRRSINIVPTEAAFVLREALREIGNG